MKVVRDKYLKTGRIIRMIRENHDFTVRKLAKFLGVSYTLISDMEIGKLGVSNDTYNLFTQKLNLSSVEKRYLFIAKSLSNPVDAIPYSVLEYIIENDLIASLEECREMDPKGTMIKGLALKK